MNQQTEECNNLYKLMPQSLISQNEISHALAINQNNKLLLVSTEKKIKCFYFQNGGLKFLTYFNCPTLKIQQFELNFINTLNFYKNKQLFISGSDTLLNKWPINILSNPKYIQRLEGQLCISSLVIHPLKENIIISGSKLGSICFWFDHTNNKEKDLLQIIEEHTKCVVGLSVNNDGSNVISAGKDGIILVMEPKIKESQQSSWRIKQKISVNTHGYRICFINNDSFTFQPYGELLLHYYILKNEEFIKDSEYPIQFTHQDCMYYFPQIYNSQKHLLFNKCGNVLNILKYQGLKKEEQLFQEGQQFKLQQAIQFDGNFNPWIFGTVSDDAEYLITWDAVSKNIQIRNYQIKNWINDL